MSAVATAPTIWERAADLINPQAPRYRWVCDLDACDGTPHDGWDYKHARTKQRPPIGNWSIWLILAGRGWGKGRTASEAFTDLIVAQPRDMDGKRTEWLIVAETFADARAICVEGPSGIRHALDARGIAYEYNKSKWNLVLASGPIVHLSGADDADVGRGFNLSGAWCVAEGTPVVTGRGAVPIERVQPGDTVATRVGWRPVTAARRTAEAARTVAIRTVDGMIRCTPDHRIWVVEKGWTAAESVTPSDRILAWSYAPVLPHTSTGMGPAGTSTRGTATTGTAPGSSFTVPSGPTPTAQSQTAMRSTTSTTTERITHSTTWPWSRRRITRASIWKRTRRASLGVSSRGRTGPGSGTTGCGRTANLTMSSALNAGPSTSRPECAPGSARQPARHASRVLAVEKSFASDVYDLTVEGAHEFFAGNVLVHNCDEMAKWPVPAATWAEGLAPALRIGNPKTIISTTPRPIAVLKEMANRRDGSVTVTQGTIYENVANLAPAAVAELRRRYEGTRIGRQELEGEFVEDVEGALWTQVLIEEHRHPYDPMPAFSKVIVAVDPNVSEGHDECGIVVCGREELEWGPRGGVLEDATTPEGPRGWAKRVVEAYHDWEADEVVAEKNNGGDLVRMTIQAVDPTVPVRLVSASRGKDARAQPVATLTESGGWGFYGLFPKLEDEITQWVPGRAGQKSPNRLDAMVWGATALLLDEGKKRKRRRLYFDGDAA